MPDLTEVPVSALPLERFKSVLEGDRYDQFIAAADRAREMFAGRSVWNVNSTARGGGVAEMLRSLLAYSRGAGVDARWLVIGGTAEFFTVTKRIHNQLHGHAGDGGKLDSDAASIYESVLEGSARELKSLIRPEDVVILHDPQTGGLCKPVRSTAAAIVWRCHVGVDVPNELARSAWSFLKPYVSPADAVVFSRRSFAWEGLDDEKVVIIPPSIDAFSPKNQELEPRVVGSILSVTGLSNEPAPEAPTFLREDGSPGTVVRRAELVDVETPPPKDVPLVVQVSRWDRLKDPVGVLDGFARFVAPNTEARLMLAGPDVTAVADDPEGAAVLAEVSERRRRLPDSLRDRVYLALLPMEDGEENAVIVNALQRRADVVVQKSVAEGFGLTVAEAMWKGRPVVASAVGGIQEQIVDGRTGLLVDPADLEGFGRAVGRLLTDRQFAESLGREAAARVQDVFLGPRHLMQYLELFAQLLA